MVREALGFDRPLHVQYLTYIGNVFRGDFGQSLSYRQPAIDIVLGALPATIELTLFAIFLAIAFAIPLGIAAALNRGTPVDGGIMTMAMFGQSIPGFWLGIMMILFFGLYLALVPDLGPRALPCAASRGRRGDRVPEPAADALLPCPAGGRGGVLLPVAERAARAVLDARGAGAGLRPHRAVEGPFANAPSSSTTRSATPGCRSSRWSGSSSASFSAASS